MDSPPLLIITSLLLLLATPAGAADHSVPDLKKTPGVTSPATAEELCATKWGKDVRHVTAAMRREVAARYGVVGNQPTAWCRRDKRGRVFEYDHSCSRENGGLDHPDNIWVQCYSGRYNALMKDRLENRLHSLMCKGKLTVREVQDQLCRADWRRSYDRQFGKR